MCTTCGCGHDDHIKIMKPNGVDASIEIKGFSAVSDHSHSHHHHNGHSHHHGETLTKDVVALERDILH